MSDPAPQPPGRDSAAEEPSATADAGPPTGTTPSDGSRPRRRGSRGGRGRSRSSRTKAAAPALTGEAAAADARLPDDLPERLREETPPPQDPAAIVSR